VTIPSDAPLGNAIAFVLQFGTGTSNTVTSNPVYLAISN
jgi:hypothetical protein